MASYNNAIKQLVKLTDVSHIDRAEVLPPALSPASSLLRCEVALAYEGMEAATATVDAAAKAFKVPFLQFILCAQSYAIDFSATLHPNPDPDGDTPNVRAQRNVREA